MALAQDLAQSTKTIEKAIKAHQSPSVKAAAFGIGGVSLVVGAVREFCKRWPEVKPQLEKAVVFLKQNDQGQLAQILDRIIKFFDVIGKVCPFIP